MSLWSNTVGKNIENFDSLSTNLLFPFASIFVEEQVKLVETYRRSYAKDAELAPLIASYWTDMAEVTKKYTKLIDDASK